MAFFSKEIKPLRFCILLGAALGAMAIGIVIWVNVTAPKWQRLRPGMSRDEAMAIMGEPVEVLEAGARVHLIYPNERMYQMTLTFDDGKLESVDGGHKGAHDLLNPISN